MGKVLVIDSDSSVADHLESLWIGLGLESALFGDGMAGMAEARREPPELIVLSVELARGSGYSLCNKIKKDGKLAEIPMILASSQASDETFAQHKRLKTCADAYIKKPYQIDELRDVSQKLLNGEVIAQSQADIMLEQEQSAALTQVEDAELQAEESSVADLLESEDTVVNEPVPPLPGPGEVENPIEKELPFAQTDGLAESPLSLESETMAKSLGQSWNANAGLTDFTQSGGSVSGGYTQNGPANDLDQRLNHVAGVIGAEQRLTQEATLAVEQATGELSKVRQELEATAAAWHTLSQKIEPLLARLQSVIQERDRLKKELAQLADTTKNFHGEIGKASDIRREAQTTINTVLGLLDDAGLGE